MDTGRTIQVWDLYIRISHWSLVVFFIIAYITAESGNILHIYSGYLVLGLILGRILWGFIGTDHARFSNFVTAKSTAIDYLKALLRRDGKRYIGHNPAGGWMILALLMTLLVISYSGLKLYALQDGLGPLAQLDSPWTWIESSHAHSDGSKTHLNADSSTTAFWEEVHEIATNLCLFLIVLHLGGVIVSSIIHRENLVKSMLTGKKPIK